MSRVEACARAAAACVVFVSVALSVGAEPVRQVKEIEPISDDVFNGVPYGRFVEVGSRLLLAADDGVAGRELWATDGTTEGTTLVKDIAPGPDSSSPRGLTALGPLAIFRVPDGPQAGLWSTDGSGAGTVLVNKVAVVDPDVWCGPDVAGSPCRTFAVLGSVAFFVGEDAEHGVELWRTDGTPEGTMPVTDLVPGPEGSLPIWPIVAGGRLFFDAAPLATGGAPSRALYTTDGTAAGTRLLKSGVKVARAAAAPRHDIWASDGTPGGTIRLTRFAEDGTVAMVTPIVGSESAAFFAVVRPRRGLELWTTDGTRAGTHVVLSGLAAPVPSPGALLRGRYYFLSGLYGNVQLWATDGTAAGTKVVKVLGQASLETPLEIESAGGRLYFSRFDYAPSFKLWESDGTEAGTRVAAVFSAASGWPPGGVAKLGSWILFGGPGDGPPFRPVLLALPAIEAAVQDARISRAGCPPTADFRITLSEPSDETITIEHATVDFSARSGLDYRSQSGTLTFPAGSTSALVRVPLLVHPRADRAPRTFFLDIGPATNAAIGRARATAIVGAGAGVCLPR